MDALHASLGALPAVLVMITAIAASFVSTFALFYPRVSFLECAFMAPGVGLSASAWLALLLKSLPIVRKGVAPEVVWLLIATQAAIAARSLPRALGIWRKERQRVLHDFARHRAALIMLGIMSVWWYYMSYIHYLLPRGSEHLTGGSVYADLPFHLNLTTSFLDGCNEAATITSSLLSSFYSGVTLAYPFLPDFYIAVLVAGGMTLRWALVCTATVLLSSLFSLIHMFNYRVTGSMRAGMMSVWLTLFAGGIGGFYYVYKEHYWWTWENLTSTQFQHGPDHVLYWVDGASAFWFSLPAHILFPQRTVQHAYPLALTALLFVWKGLSGTPPHDDVHEQYKRDELSNTSPQPVWAGDDSEPVGVSVIEGGADAHAATSSSADGSGSASSSSVLGHSSTVARRANRSASAQHANVHVTPTKAGAAGAGSAPGTPSSSKVHDNTAVLFTHRKQLGIFAFAGFVSAMIPLMQPHSFASIGMIILIAAGVRVTSSAAYIMCCGGGGAASASATNGGSASSGTRAWRTVLDSILQWTAYGAVAISLGAPQFLKHFVHRVTFGVGSSGGGFVRLSPAWAEEGKGEDFFITWWKALGFFLPTYAFSFLLLTTSSQRSFYLGFTFLFFMCNFVMFQPWHLDNTKLLYVWVFGASGFVALALHRLLACIHSPRFGRSPVMRVLGYLVTGAAFILLTFSGAMATWREMLNYAKLYDDIDFDYAAWIKGNTHPSSIFLHDVTQSNHIRVETSLAGRQTASGFAGWLHSHGINSNSRRIALNSILRGDVVPGIMALSSVNISYITVEAGTTGSFNHPFLDDVSVFLATNGKFSVYGVLPEIRDGSFLRSPKECATASGSASEETCVRDGACWYWPSRAPEKRCISKPRKRAVADCTPGEGVTADSCKAQGCLWIPNFAGPWCQKASWQLPEGKPPAQIAQLSPGVPGSDCGWHNMQVSDCEKRGCVWRTPSDPWQPYCVFK